MFAIVELLIKRYQTYLLFELTFIKDDEMKDYYSDYQYPVDRAILHMSVFVNTHNLPPESRYVDIIKSNCTGYNQNDYIITH
jgi:hypothetical protein